MRRQIVLLGLVVGCGGGGTPNAPVPVPVDASVALDASVEAGIDGGADAGPRDGGAPRAAFQPSSGNELKASTPKIPTKEESRAWLAPRLARAAQPKHDCAELVDPNIAMHLQFARYEKNEIVKDEDAWITIARCAERQKAFVLLQSVALVVGMADPLNGHPELMVRALIGANKLELARKGMDALLAKRKTDPHVHVTAAKLACRERRWADCRDLAAETPALAQIVSEPERTQVVLRAEKYRARALLHLNKVEEASAAMDKSEKMGVDKDDVQEFRAQVASVRSSSMIIEPAFSPEIPLGVYHLYGKGAGGLTTSLLRLDLENMAPKDRQLRIEIEIPGVTEKAVQTVAMGKASTTKIDITPPLRQAFDIRSVRANQAAQISLKITSLEGGEKTVLEHGYPVTLMSRDFLPICTYTEADRTACTLTPQFFAAWVTPNAKAIDGFLAAAKKRAPKGAFIGMQGPTLPQVQALYDELKERGMSYVMDPYVLSDGHKGQRTRLPTEVLESTNAQCLEGTLLYATLLEAIGLQPVIVRVPGHAFVGWHPHPSEKPVGRELYYLETTMTHTATFAEATDRAAKEALPVETSAKPIARPGAPPPPAAQLMKGMYDRIEIADLRKKGITPQPYD